MVFGSRIKRAGSFALKMAFPSYWISSWAEKKHKEIESPAVKAIVEGLTYRKAYLPSGALDSIDRIRENVAKVEGVEAEMDDSAQRAYADMMNRQGFSERDREVGIGNLKRELRMFRVLMVITLVLVLVSVFFWGWAAFVMAVLSFLLSWLKGTVAAFYLWQTEQRACYSFRGFVVKHGGWLSVFEF